MYREETSLASERAAVGPSKVCGLHLDVRGSVGGWEGSPGAGREEDPARLLQLSRLSPDPCFPEGKWGTWGGGAWVRWGPSSDCWGQHGSIQAGRGLILE